MKQSERNSYMYKEQHWPKRRSKATEQKLVKIKDMICQIQVVFDQLVGLAKDKNPEVRFDSIEAFQEIIPPGRECLFEALVDSDELVRVSALEGIGILREEIMSEKIVALLVDASPLVRGAAAICLADIGSTCAEELIQKKLEDAEDEEKVSYLFALCKLGRKEYFLSLLNFLFHDFYRIRTAVANLLVELVDDSNAAFVLNLLTVRSSKEETIAAKSAIDTAIQEIKKQWPEIKKKKHQKV